MQEFLGFLLIKLIPNLKRKSKLKQKNLQNANEKLKALDNKKNEFLSIASHELKSPIQPIVGFAELAKSGDIETNEALDGITLLANRLQNLTNDLLDVSRIESNRLNLHLNKTKINDLILEILKTLKISDNVKIETNLQKDIELNIDKNRVEQVLINLLNNAMKFSTEGKISITTEVDEKNNEVKIKVSDDGPGIPKEIKNKIFEKFVTKTQGMKNQEGTGLGLFLCKGIMEAHNGKIRVKNNPNQGSTFEIIFPIFKNDQLQKIHLKN